MPCPVTEYYGQPTQPTMHFYKLIASIRAAPRCGWAGPGLCDVISGLPLTDHQPGHGRTIYDRCSMLNLKWPRHRSDVWGIGLAVLRGYSFVLCPLYVSYGEGERDASPLPGGYTHWETSIFNLCSFHMFLTRVTRHWNGLRCVDQSNNDAYNTRLRPES